MNENHSTISRYKLSAIRKLKGLTVSGAAREVGCHRQTINKLESGELRLTEEWILRLSRAYGCTASELMGDAPVLSAEERELMLLANSMTQAERVELIRFAAQLRRRGPKISPTE